MSNEQRADVVVIGGGPGGSMAAGHLALEHRHVVLLEREQLPRPAVGESLIPHIWRYIDSLGATKAIEEAAFVEKAGGLSLWGDTLRRLRFSDFGHTRKALHVERDVFDKILIDRCRALGVDVRERCRVTQVHGLDGDGDVRVIYQDPADETREVRCRHLIDASGQSAVVAQQIGARVFDQALRFSAFWGYFEGGRYLTYDGAVHPIADLRQTPPATLVSTIGDNGWVWHIALRDRVSIGLILPHDRLGEIKASNPEQREQKFQDIVSKTALVGDLLEGATFRPGSLRGIRDYAYKPNRMAIGKALLAGDAAAFVDPINSAGVVFSMYAGTMAAIAINSSLHNPPRASFYGQLFESQYKSRLALFRLLAIPDAKNVLSPSEIEMARQAISSSSSDERLLAMWQATLSNRPEAMDDVLQVLGQSERPTPRELSLDLIMERLGSPW